MMNKTDMWLYLYHPSAGWYRGFKRRVYEDENGTLYVDMRGWTTCDWAIAHADWYRFERD